MPDSNSSGTSITSAFGAGSAPTLLAPGRDPRPDPRPDQPLEEGALLVVDERALGDRRAVHGPAGSDLLAPAAHDRVADLGVGIELVDDGVRGERGGAEAAQGRQRLGLPGADAARQADERRRAAQLCSSSSCAGSSSAAGSSATGSSAAGSSGAASSSATGASSSATGASSSATGASSAPGASATGSSGAAPRARRRRRPRRAPARHVVHVAGVAGQRGADLAARQDLVLDPLDREREAAPLGVDLEDLDLHVVAGLDDLARVLDVLLGELGDVHEALDALQDLHERAEGDDLRDRALELVTDVVGVDDALPRVLLGLLEAQGDALTVTVYVEHLDLDRVADVEDLARVVDVRPRELGDVDQAVDAVEVDEGAEVDDVGDLALDDQAGLQALQDGLALLLALFFMAGFFPNLLFAEARAWFFGNPENWVPGVISIAVALGCGRWRRSPRVRLGTVMNVGLVFDVVSCYGISLADTSSRRG